jgi:Flp pilus assembly protein protease CpaA
MFEDIKLAIALGTGLICGLYDLKTSNMLDQLAWAVIAIGIGLHAYESYVTGNWFILQWCLIVVGLFFVFSLFMYYRGYWGGGDGEMLISYGALLPFGVNNSLYFPLALFINIFVVGGVYSLIYGLARVRMNKTLWKKLKKEMEDYEFRIITCTVLLTFSLALFLTGSKFYSFPLVLSLLLAYKPLLRFGRFVETKVFKTRIPVSKLKVDDVLGEDIPELNLSSKLVRGLTEEEVKKIKKVRKYVVIKDGVRFIPVFPLALLLSLTGFPFAF